VTPIDWIIIGACLLVALYGYAQGFIVGVLSLVGFAVGAFVGTRLAPLVLSGGAHSPYAPLFGLAGALVAGAILAIGLEGVGVAVRRRLRLPGLALVDGVLGALLTACVALGVAWIAGAAVLQAPGTSTLRHDIQRSVILRNLNAILPPAGPILNALSRLDPLPQIRGPEADVPPPRSGILRDPGVQRARRSVVRVLGTACGLNVEGSGWVAAPGIVVTNAHVVAGEDDTTVEADGSPPQLGAQALYFDPSNDLAVLSVPQLDRPRLDLVPDPSRGDGGAVLGYPQNGPFDAEPARLGGTQTFSSQDAYGRGPVSRSITAFRGRVRSGNSGGPVVSSTGRVLTTVFASTVGGGARGGYGVPNDIVRRALARADRPVSTGACAH
jgi:Trypsin-like peptidase domain/Colicin V production protein